jgi:hypothetical protein
MSKLAGITILGLDKTASGTYAFANTISTPANFVSFLTINRLKMDLSNTTGYYDFVTIPFINTATSKLNVKYTINNSPTTII